MLIFAKAMRFLGVAQAYAAMSKDRRRKVGAIALDSSYAERSQGFNGFPRSVDESIEARHEKPEKFFWSSHAEENLVANAARPVLQGTTVIVTELFPCTTCARLLIQAGVAAVIAPRPTNAASKWTPEAARALAMFQEAGVVVTYDDGIPA